MAYSTSKPLSLSVIGGDAEHLDRQKPVLARPLVFGFSPSSVCCWRLQAQIGNARIDRPGLRADDPQPLGNRALVDDLHEHGRIAGLLKHGLGRAAEHLHARFRIDRHHQEHVRIEKRLQLRGIAAGRPRPRSSPCLLLPNPRPRRSNACMTRRALAASGWPSTAMTGRRSSALAEPNASAPNNTSCRQWSGRIAVMANPRER